MSYEVTYTREERTLTGRARLRTGWFGRVVTQVEVRVETRSMCPPPPGRKNDEAWREFCLRGERIEWRDAKADDVATMMVLAK